MDRGWVVGILVGVAATALTALVAVLVWYTPAEINQAADDVVASPVEPPSEEPSDEASDGPSDEASAAGLPLLDPGEHLPADGSSDVPAAGSDLVEGDYVGHVVGIDPGARTVVVDVEVFYSGQAAIDYLAAHEPDEENPPPNDYWIANDSTDVRTLALADDARVWDWCFTTSGGELGFAERSVAEWAAAPAGGGDMACDAGPALSRGGNEVYWLQVRGGEVARLIGQYLP